MWAMLWIKGGTTLLPYLFKLGPITVYSWGLSLSIAIIAGTLVGLKLARRIGMNSEQVVDFALSLVVGGIVGARLFFVFVYEPEYYLKEPLQIFALWNGGMVYYGAFLGGLVTGTWYVVRHKMPFWTLADLVALPLILGYSIVRIGCFLNGCCYGKLTTSFLGVMFPQVDEVSRYPTQIFSSLFGFALFVFLMWLYERKKFEGQVFLSLVIFYSIGRIVIEAFRENLVVFAGITVSQLVSTLIMLPAVYFYWQRRS
jgi:phosphatidylglycerol:prolipoprotein diacylglycerol transferase